MTDVICVFKTPDYTWVGPLWRPAIKKVVDVTPRADRHALGAVFLGVYCRSFFYLAVEIIISSVTTSFFYLTVERFLV